MTDDDTKPIGFDTLREALAVIIEHEAERARPNSDRGKLSLPKSEHLSGTPEQEA
jgi:hypothetical protein